MCGPSGWPNLAAMDAPHTAISLEVRLAGDCLTGTATSATGVERPFSGWLGLIAAIDALLPPDSATPTPTEER